MLKIRERNVFSGDKGLLGKKTKPSLTKVLAAVIIATVVIAATAKQAAATLMTVKATGSTASGPVNFEATFDDGLSDLNVDSTIGKFKDIAGTINVTGPDGICSKTGVLIYVQNDGSNTIVIRSLDGFAFLQATGLPIFNDFFSNIQLLSQVPSNGSSGLMYGYGTGTTGDGAAVASVTIPEPTTMTLLGAGLVSSIMAKLTRKQRLITKSGCRV